MTGFTDFVIKRKLSRNDISERSKFAEWIPVDIS